MINKITLEKQFKCGDLMKAAQNVIDDKTSDNVVILLDKLIKYGYLDNDINIFSSNFSTATKAVEIIIDTEYGFELIVISGLVFFKRSISNTMADTIKQNHIYEISRRPDNVIKDMICKHAAKKIITEKETTDFLDAVRNFVYKDKNERFIETNLASLDGTDYVKVVTNKHRYIIVSDGFRIKIKIKSIDEPQQHKSLKDDSGFNIIKDCPEGEFLISNSLKTSIVETLIKIGYMPSNSLRVMTDITVTVVNDGVMRKIKVIRNGITIYIPVGILDAICQ